MDIQRQLEKTTDGYWAKFVYSIDQIGSLNRIKNDRIKFLNTYFEKFGFSSIGDNWKSIPKAYAVECLTFIISRSIPYGDEVLPLPESKAIAHAFIDNLDGNAKFFTNVSPCSWKPFKLYPSWSAAWNYEDYLDERGLGYLNCISVIGFDKEKMGILCKLESD